MSKTIPFETLTKEWKKDPEYVQEYENLNPEFEVFMKDMMEFKGYYGSVHYSNDDVVFYGKIEYIRSLVTYEGMDIASLRKAFEDAVDDYLSLCKERDTPPEKPFKGTFNVRLSSALHRKAALTAYERHINLNTIVAEALEHYLE